MEIVLCDWLLFQSVTLWQSQFVSTPPIDAICVYRFVLCRSPDDMEKLAQATHDSQWRHTNKTRFLIDSELIVQ